MKNTNYKSRLITYCDLLQKGVDEANLAIESIDAEVSLKKETRRIWVKSRSQNNLEIKTVKKQIAELEHETK